MWNGDVTTSRCYILVLSRHDIAHPSAHQTHELLSGDPTYCTTMSFARNPELCEFWLKEEMWEIVAAPWVVSCTSSQLLGSYSTTTASVTQLLEIRSCGRSGAL